jgi:Phosphotransferase enzyme family
VDENLVGGIANAGKVVRSGEFVLRPTNPHSATIHGFLKALRATGFQGASLAVEIESDCWERLIYIEGDVAIPPYPAWAQSDEALASITRLANSFHEASRKVAIPLGPWSDEMADPEGGPIICHNDICLENVVFRDGGAVGLIDFDFAAPGRPIYDLAALALMCVPVDDDLSAARRGWAQVDRLARLRLVADIYGLDDSGRVQMLNHLDRSIARGGVFLQRRVAAGDPNFIRIFDEIGGMERYDRRRRWWEANRAVFADAMA